MEFLVGLVVVALVWLLFRALRSKKKAQEPIEIPVKVKITYEEDRPRQTAAEEVDKDAWEGSFWEVQHPINVKARLKLDYVDGNRKASSRTVDVREFGSFGDTCLLIGHCHMRGATRTFRTDRIKRCIDEETGEVIEDVRAYLTKRYEESPERSRDRLMEDEYDVLRALLYLGKADGQLRAAEKAVIRETCVALVADSRLTDKQIDDLFATLDVPTLQAFRLAVGRLAKRDESRRQVLLDAAQKMVGTQKAVHQAEQEALDYMRKRFAVEG
ncbi:MAG: WYL domain-containing protein [Anaerolineae bacterium]|jgi:hypothetical protein|nr:WYL domain-containing protein [Anaerolineae bacterium]